MEKDKKIVHDSMGPVEIPADAMYQAQTQRALDNFQISDLHLPGVLIHALVLIKKSCARVNRRAGKLDEQRADAIERAANSLLAGVCADQFQIDVFQTGSGTSTNMNVNEVIATLAADAVEVHPNDHVNMGQSSNDVFPSAIHVATCQSIHNELLPALQSLEQALWRRSEAHAETLKTGRTHLMDAMPITLGQEISAWAAQIRDARYRIQTGLTRLQQLAIGGTAVGTGVNTSHDFGEQVCAVLQAETGIRFSPMVNRFQGLSTQDSALEMSGHFRVLATSLSKICNDLRWMNSGPLSGLGEITLEAVQPGSSIMPGKVNPVVPEAILMAAAQVQGNDTTIAIAAQSGNFQLNVMLPVIAYNLLQSSQILANSCPALSRVVDRFEVNVEVLQQDLAQNPVLVTALNPIVGYQRAAEIAKTALAEKRPIIDIALEMTDLDEAELRRLLDPARLAHKHHDESE